jgi:exopolysaccharide biosynthesis polyprenyl glycosylphosphotransferase
MLKQIHQDKLRQILLNRYDHIGTTNFIYQLRFYSKRLTWNLVIRSAYLLKRLLDIVASGIIILLLSPLFLTIAALIYIESPGAVLFKQTRVGRWGTLFTMWKFRSMYMDAEERKKQLMQENEMSGGVLFKMKRDPRITKIGRFIRKASIDELPQLWNVFKGDMSLVGPRPPVPAEVDQYSLADRRRLEVIPGITCVWQVSGRSDIPFPEQVELDVEYIESQSLWNDIKILFQTIPAVLMGKGAY